MMTIVGKANVTIHDDEQDEIVEVTIGVDKEGNIVLDGIGSVYAELFNDQLYLKRYKWFVSIGERGMTIIVEFFVTLALIVEILQVMKYSVGICDILLIYSMLAYAYSRRR